MIASRGCRDAPFTIQVMSQLSLGETRRFGSGLCFYVQRRRREWRHYAASTPPFPSLYRNYGARIQSRMLHPLLTISTCLKRLLKITFGTLLAMIPVQHCHDAHSLAERSFAFRYGCFVFIL